MENYNINYLSNSFGHELNEHFVEHFHQHEHQEHHQPKSQYEIPLQGAISEYDGCEMYTNNHVSLIYTSFNFTV